MINEFSRLCTEAEFFDEIQTKVFGVFFLAILCLETYISSNSRNLLQLLQFRQCNGKRKEKEGKCERKPYPLPYGLRNLYRNLKSENSQDYAQKP
jgi:hypothetical protein